ncbi:MAG: hypothetical protein KBC44_01160 [Candidatus Pacebacteria bacterium]|nr:hypothetical protein [Candidatus Paceibacterota bacterium]MBP9839571.1 hypothetical protein [Candidatus Paceibacterota bacterium]
MKLKKITLISFIAFLGVFVLLLFITPAREITLNNNTSQEDLDLEGKLENILDIVSPEEGEPVQVEEKKETTSTPKTTTTPTPTTSTKPTTTKPTTTTPTKTSTRKTLSSTEVAKHSTREDCYLIVKNIVYDVTTYIDKHPGGKSKIVNKCGQESSSAFAAIHSNFAWNLLAKYYVADLVK